MFKIYRPIHTDFLTQKFGENLACIKVDDFGKAIRPFQVLPGVYPGTCPIGSTKFYPEIGLKAHNGQDWSAYHGEPIYFPAVSDPAVTWKVINEVDADGGIGVNVYSQQPIPFDTLPVYDEGAFKMIRNQYDTLGGKLFPMFKFWHLLSPAVPDGTLVKAGDLIGYGDSTGASSGDHLHWSMKIHGGSVQGFGFSIDSDNGYTGALDQTQYYENKFILDVTKPSFVFTKSMKLGDVNTDVGVMQALLVRHGFMQPFKSDEVGIYGPKTQRAVYNFQLKYLDLSWYERNVMKGSVAGPKTIVKLNGILGSLD